jgi:serine/threonine-protein kinase
MTQSPLPVAPGEIVADKYRIESVLGRGGMGVVLAATHLRLEQRVAIKFLVQDEGSEPGVRERFEREARAASKIRSEHVVRVLDVGVLESGVPYIVMEFLEGEDLANTLRRRGAFPAEEAVSYVLQACEALAEAHRAGIVHRDLKPANMFLAHRADGSAAIKLLDFGISKLPVQSGHGSITNETILGSPRYMSPEQIRSAHDVDVRSDVWSLGATLFELVSGQPAFRGATIPELCSRILEGPAPDLDRTVSGAPPGLSAAVRHCLEKQPAQRYASVAELAIALAPFGPAHAHVSVERVARILGAKPASPPAGVSSFDAEVQRLQDASTMKSLESGAVLQPRGSGGKDSGAGGVGEQVRPVRADETARTNLSSNARARSSRRQGGKSSHAVLALSALLGAIVTGGGAYAVLRGHAFAPSSGATASGAASSPSTAESPSAHAPSDEPRMPPPVPSTSPHPESAPTPTLAPRRDAPKTATSPSDLAGATVVPPAGAPSPTAKSTGESSDRPGAPAPLNTQGFGDRR